MSDRLVRIKWCFKFQQYFGLCIGFHFDSRSQFSPKLTLQFFVSKWQILTCNSYVEFLSFPCQECEQSGCLFVSLWGFYNTPTLFKSYSTEETFESVNWIEVKCSMKHVMVYVWTFGPCSHLVWFFSEHCHGGLLWSGGENWSNVCY